MTAVSDSNQLSYIAAQAADARVNVELEAEGMTLNIGPQHPATHGTLRIIIRLDGEQVIEVDPILGYMHRGYEKLTEVRTYPQVTTLINRIDWVLRQPIDIFCLELGANDALRGLDPEETEKNLNGIINKVQATFPHVQIILLGMMAPPNMGIQYSEEFNKIYPELATKHQCAIVPFLLDGVAGITELNLRDGIHPNKRGHKVLKDNVWQVLKDYL